MGTKKSNVRSSHRFSQVPQAQISRSTFNRDCGHKCTFESGELVPIFVDEALPGDTFNMKMSMFARVATLLDPIMDNVYLDVFWFFVPMRLIWTNWEKFNGAQDDPGDSTDFLIPTMTGPPTNGYIEQTLGDHLGLPIYIPDLKHNAHFHRSYALIWNEWFRDENLQDSIVVDKDDGPDNTADYVLQKRGKRHDYFTSCLPWPQKGDAVELPLGTSAPVVSTGDGIPLFDVGSTSDNFHESGGASQVSQWGLANPSGGIAGTWADTKLEADLSSATAATINALRQAFQIQRLYERDARGGSRYTETIKSHFGVTSPDQRLQRPEYLGGGSAPLMVTPVAGTSSSGAGDQLGKLGGFGVAAGTGMGFTKSFVEHGVVMGLVASRADLNYQSGMDRMFSRQTRWDFFWPALQHLGEQVVKNKEIAAQGSGDLVADEAAFGYQERFAEYRYKASTIAGKFRSLASGSLDIWHLAQDFGTLPTLNASFIEEDPPMDRVIAVPSEPHFLFDSHFNLKCARPMPVYSVPGLIDHF